MLITYQLENIASIAPEIIQVAKHEKIWLFEGEMGAGKTTLIKALCHEAGVQGNVQSPTFSIVNEYKTKANETIYHFDCYRLKSEEEAYDIGVEEYLDGQHRCWIEWPDKIENFLPNHFARISILKISENTRQLTIDFV